jgi:hypothetical protein
VPPAGLSGAWTGSITFYVNPADGDEPCEEVTSIAVSLSQSGGSVSGQISAGCHGTLLLNGTLRGAQIFGSIEDSAGFSYGQVRGTASAERIKFQAVQLQPGDGDEPDSDRDDYFVSCLVDLRR